MSLITEQMRDAVGTELDRAVSFPVSASDIRRWALAVYHPAEPPRQFWDVDAAARTIHGGIVAPEEFNPFAWMNGEPAGKKPSYGPGGPSLEARIGIAEVGLTSMLNGGTDIRYGTRMRPGDVITATTVLDDYAERDGRLGLMLFTKTKATWTNQHDENVKVLTNTLIRY
jgi:hypothetical protein